MEVTNYQSSRYYVPPRGFISILGGADINRKVCEFLKYEDLDSLAKVSWVALEVKYYYNTHYARDGHLLPHVFEAIERKVHQGQADSLDNLITYMPREILSDVFSREVFWIFPVEEDRRIGNLFVLAVSLHNQAVVRVLLKHGAYQQEARLVDNTPVTRIVRELCHGQRAILNAIETAAQVVLPPPIAVGGKEISPDSTTPNYSAQGASSSSSATTEVRRRPPPRRREPRKYLLLLLITSIAIVAIIALGRIYINRKRNASLRIPNFDEL